ncbi:hypothetical protein THRCLA_01107 [Thraustotheca clavata]|uniref:FYVE-type domain-containing protein n=1 Tax=Thraustotheca clavata TaxID=74557 RepID=A0A1W0A9F2_9STRA|nr:hypothetical protein THRCLA_01107 [Thraustotheca clavata]
MSTETLQLVTKTGCFEFKYKSGPFSSWSIIYAKLEGRWLALYKKEDTNVRTGAIEIGPYTSVKNPGELENFPRRFDLVCSGGSLPDVEWSFHFEKACEDMEKHVPQLKRPFTIKSLKSKPTIYIKSFNGDEAMKVLVEMRYARDLIEAFRICETLLSMNLIHHALWSCDFSQQELYCFTSNQKPQVVGQVFSDLLETNKYWIHIEGSLDRSMSSATYASATFEEVPPSQRANSVRSNHSGGSDDRHTIHSVVSGLSDDQASTISGASYITREIALLPPHEWANPDSVKKCQLCDKSFTPLRRKHHCRVCGAVVCGTCGVFTNLVVGGELVNVRVCTNCRGADCHRHFLKQGSATSTEASWVPTASSTCSSQNSCADCEDLCAPTTVTSYRLNFHWEHSWPKAPVPSDEPQRLEALKNTQVLQAEPEPLFEHLCNMAATAAKCPIAVLGFIDKNAFRIVAQYGLPESLPRVLSRDVAYASHTIMSPNPLICRDTSQDIRFSRNAIMREQWNVGFYASCPIVLDSGDIIGVLEVYDGEARSHCSCIGDRLETIVKVVVKHLDEILRVPEPAPVVPAPVAPAPSTMENKLLELLQKTTGTQEQLQQQQVQMVDALGTHSKQIDMLTEQLRRMEATLDAKADR